jgi:hypothetical protein
MQQPPRASSILGMMFNKMASIPFNKNHDLMEQHEILSFANLNFDDPIAKDDCSPHLTFTSNGFFNKPHEDNCDISDYAFTLFLPHNKVDGTLANPNSGYDVSGGPFVFPGYRFGIDFSKHKGIVKLLWTSKTVQHCTLPPI